ncbi:MAG: Arc family DNA-binding protein [Chloroflexi bacterium]|nr:Arc family DNA-binding protein [Chloroflexota bacterium]
MPTITVKNIPPDVYDLLKQSAAANRRSINSEIITHIERGVLGRKIDPEALLARARHLRHKTKSHSLTDREFKAAKHAGRL